MEKNKENKQGGGERKQLTPQQVQQRKKMLVYPLLFLIFAAFMWLIFSPSKADREKEQQGTGLNAELPDPGKDGIVGSKRDAYEQEQLRSKQEERMRSLADFSALLGDAENDPEVYERQLKMAPRPPEYYENPELFENGYKSTRSGNALQSSAYAYEDINRQLGSFYEEPAAEPDEPAPTALELRIQELERKLDEEAMKKKAEDDQIALMEKSYQLAAKYMPASQGQDAAGAGSATAADGNSTGAVKNGKALITPVGQVRPATVSALPQQVSDSAFVADWSQERNTGFHTAVGTEGQAEKNTIKACIHDNQTITDGQAVRMRLLEPMKAGATLLPRNTVVTGMGRITGERLGISITSLEYGGTILPVELTVYDSDGQPGIFIPGSMEVNAAKEIAANMGAGLGSSINISHQSAGGQLLTDLGRGAIQGTSQYISKKIREVKVHLKAGYNVMLYQNRNQ